MQEGLAIKVHPNTMSWRYQVNVFIVDQQLVLEVLVTRAHTGSTKLTLVRKNVFTAAAL